MICGKTSCLYDEDFEVDEWRKTKDDIYRYWCVGKSRRWEKDWNEWFLVMWIVKATDFANEWCSSSWRHYKGQREYYNELAIEVFKLERPQLNKTFVPS